jgi:hypothetical protein
MARKSLDEIFGSQAVTPRKSLDDIFGSVQQNFVFNPEIAAKVKANNEFYDNKSQLDGVGLEAIKGFGSGAKIGAENLLQGATAGLYGVVNRSLGGDFAERNRANDALAETAGLGAYNTAAKVGTDILGSIGGAGAAAYNLAGRAGLKGLARLAGAGALESGIRGASEGETLQEAASNIIPASVVGGVAGGATGAIGKAIKRLVPSLNVIGKKGLNDAFTDRETTIALKRGAKASQRISDELAQEMPMVKDNINTKMNNVVNDIIGETPDISGMMDKAKAGYADYMVMNAENPVNLDSLRNSYQKYTPFEKKALTDALKSANFETNAPVGTVEHTHQMRMAIDDAIDSAMKKSNNRHVPSLNKIRKSLDDILKSDTGYKAIDDKYAQAMKLQEAYNSGYAATKTSKAPTFANDLERKAWISGANDKLKNNLVNTDSNYAQSVANNLSILKNGMDNAEFKSLKKAANAINKEYARAAQVDKVVNKESAAENLPFWREILESMGSAIGATVGSAEKALYGLSDIATANRILSGAPIPQTSRFLDASRYAVPSISSLMAQKVVEK